MRQSSILFLLFTLLLASSTPEPQPIPFRPGKDHAILFAINTYKAPLTNLSNPITNAQQIATELQNRFGFKPEIFENPTSAQIEATLRDYASRFTHNLNGEYPSSGQLFIFFSGHGTEQLENGFFLPADADMNNLRQTSLQYSYLRPLINAINCQHILVAVDACYSVTFDEDFKKKNDFVFSRPGELSENDKILANHNQYKARVFFTSDAVGDMTPDKSNFAKKLLEGLRTFNAQSGFMTSSELFANYVQKASPTPHGGEFGADEAGSTFLFFQQEKSTNFDIQSYEQTQRDILAWKVAQTTNTHEAYLDYLQKFPQGTFREDASKTLAIVEEDQHWELARRDNTLAAYQAYLKRYPTGRYASEAKKNLQPATASDRDSDGVPDTRDACPTEKGLARFDGCPDTDSDGIPDSNDGCPNQVGPASNRGCPLPSMSSFVDPFDDVMIFIKGGTFQMGYNEGNVNATPVHSVTVSDFYLAKTEVTQAQWRAIMGSDPPGLEFNGCDQCPVEKVSWSDVQKFIKKLNAIKNKSYRLPTEAEWEYAAREGKNSTYYYSGSNDLHEVAWDYFNSGRKTQPVGQKKPNALGLYDMSGNVWEWCQDWFGIDYYAKSPSINPQGPKTGSSHICRGGAWNENQSNMHIAVRNSIMLDFPYYNIGFRLARQQ